MPFEIAWIDLEGIIVSEISQIEKGKNCVISLTCGILKNQMHKQNSNRVRGTENKQVVARREWSRRRKEI